MVGSLPVIQKRPLKTESVRNPRYAWEEHNSELQTGCIYHAGKEGQEQEEERRQKEL